MSLLKEQVNSLLFFLFERETKAVIYLLQMINSEKLIKLPKAA